MQGDRRANGGIAGLGAAAGEDDFVGRDAEQRGHLFARGLHRLAGAAGEAVPARRIRPVLTQKRQHRLPRLGAERRGGIVVEINEVGRSHGTRSIAAADAAAKTRNDFILCRRDHLCGLGGA